MQNLLRHQVTEPSRIHVYSICDQNLDPVQRIKSLGVTLSNSLSGKQHIHNITGKASKTLGFLKRNLRVNSTSIKETAYKALVRPQVEYAAAIWGPGYLDDIKTLESVQRRSARWVLHRYHSTLSVTAMIGQLGWRYLAKQKVWCPTDHVLQIFHGLVAISPLQYVQPVKRVTRHHSFSGLHPATSPLCLLCPDVLSQNYYTITCPCRWRGSDPVSRFLHAARLVNLTMHLWRSLLCNPQLVGATQYWKKKKKKIFTGII